MFYIAASANEIFLCLTISFLIVISEDGDLPYEQGTGDLGHLPRQNSISGK